MIKFLFKGVVRDRHRSLFPVMIVSTGVALTVLLHCWLTGFVGDIVDSNAKFSTGHVKIMTKAYAENLSQVPNDLALTAVDTLVRMLDTAYPQMVFVRRIRFGGLVDVPDENGETRAQGPAMGMAFDLLSAGSTELERLDIANSIVRGRMPQQPGEILLSDMFASQMGVQPGETVTLMSSTMYGSMALQNFTVSGMIRFGVMAMDRGALIMDIHDAQQALDMQDAAGEILGYFKNNQYDDLAALKVATDFAQRIKQTDEFSPVMERLTEQNDLGANLTYFGSIISSFVFIFVLAMSIVLWNAGLIGGLRRFGEMGLRLAIGEEKHHVYGSLIIESVFVGTIGSIIGSAIGLVLSYILQTKGIDLGGLMKSSSLMMPMVFRAQVTAQAYYIGFIPGLLSTVLGTALSGIGIYRRKTAHLFKELEN